MAELGHEDVNSEQDCDDGDDDEDTGTEYGVNGRTEDDDD